MTIRDELDTINAGFGRALLEQDAESLAGYYTDDARLLFHGSPIIRGRAAVEATMRDWVGGGPQVLKFETGEVIADGSLVVDIGTIVGPSSRSKYVVVYQRQADGSLKIAVDAATSDGPSAAS
jgi:ketosteroid isomerase-like protein